MEEVIGIDVVELAIDRARSLIPQGGMENLHYTQIDFFEYDETNPFNVIIDHTFLCALPPSRRLEWAKKMEMLLNPGGVLISYMFPLGFHADGPPFALSLSDYNDLLGNTFDMVYLKPITNRFHTWMPDCNENVGVFRRKAS